MEDTNRGRAAPRGVASWGGGGRPLVVNLKEYYDEFYKYWTERFTLFVILIILIAITFFCMRQRERHPGFRYGQWIFGMTSVSVVILLMWYTDETAFLVSLWFFGSLTVLAFLIALGIHFCKWRSNKKQIWADTCSEGSEAEEPLIVMDTNGREDGTRMKNFDFEESRMDFAQF